MSRRARHVSSTNPGYVTGPLEGRPLAGRMKGGRTTMRMVCAWCSGTLVEGDPDGPTSHGACPGCARKMIADIAVRAISELIEAVDRHGRWAPEVKRATKVLTTAIYDIVDVPSENGPDGDASQRVDSRQDRPPGDDDSKVAESGAAGNSGRNGDYVVTVGSPGGVVAEKFYPDFAAMVVGARELADRYCHPSRQLVFGNADRADIDTNGLSEDEELLLEELGW